MIAVLVTNGTLRFSLLDIWRHVWPVKNVWGSFFTLNNSNFISNTAEFPLILLFFYSAVHSVLCLSVAAFQVPLLLLYWASAVIPLKWAAELRCTVIQFTYNSFCSRSYFCSLRNAQLKVSAIWCCMAKWGADVWQVRYEPCCLGNGPRKHLRCWWNHTASIG